MNWIFIIILVLNSMVILIHILAITLLISLNENNVSGSQKLLLKALCVTELIYVTIDIALVCCFFLDEFRCVIFLCIYNDNDTN